MRGGCATHCTAQTRGERAHNRRGRAFLRHGGGAGSAGTRGRGRGFCRWASADVVGRAGEGVARGEWGALVWGTPGGVSLLVIAAEGMQRGACARWAMGETWAWVPGLWGREGEDWSCASHDEVWMRCSGLEPQRGV